MTIEHQKGEPDCQALGQWVHVTATHTRDQLLESNPYLGVFTQNWERIAKVDERIERREEIDGRNPVILLTWRIIRNLLRSHNKGIGRHMKP